MIEVLPESQGKILGIKAVGKLTDEDYKNVLIPRINGILADSSKARVLFVMNDDFQGWEFAAAWDDFTFGMKHKNDFEKCAVVGGPRWVEWATKVAALIMSGEVKTFSLPQITDAWSWINS